MPIRGVKQETEVIYGKAKQLEEKHYRGGRGVPIKLTHGTFSKVIAYETLMR